MFTSKRRRNMVRRSLIVCLAIAMVLFSSFSVVWATETSTNPLKLVKGYEQGKLYTLGQANVVVLSGTFRDMGRQYGALLGDQISQLYEEGINKPFIQTGMFSTMEVNAFVKQMYQGLPKRQKELLLGMAEGSGLPQEKVLCASEPVGIILLVRKKFNGSNTGACSSVAVWGKRTVDGQTFTARNYDFPSLFRGLAQRFLTIVVYKPTDGSNAVAGVGLAGMISFIDAMNDKGLYFQNNNAADSAGLVLYPTRTEATTQLSNILFDADSKEEYNLLLNSQRISYPTIVMLADGKSASYYELAPWDLKERKDGGEQAIAAANQFLLPEWGMLNLPSPSDWYSTLRQSNMLTLATSSRAKVDEKYMMSILDVQLFNKDWSLGKGAAVIDKNPHEDEVTVWQVVTAPAKKRLYFRAPTVTDWQMVDLTELTR